MTNPILSVPTAGPANRPPTILIVFGATGDLMARKLVPALFHMKSKDGWPERFTIIGLSRSIGDDQAFRQHIGQALATHGDAHPKDDDAFFRAFHSIGGDFTDPKVFNDLLKKVDQIELEWGVCANKLIYLSVQPSAYPSILRNVAAVNLNIPCSVTTGWTRILVEKPYGSTLDEAERIDALLKQYFKPEQVYRIDHYHGKQAVQNILLFRFANSFLEPAWDREHIESVEVRVHEKMTLNGRGAFYDQVGALLDVGHNHMLEMLALVTMDHPLRLSSDIVWQKRTEILEALEPIRDFDRQTYRAQYDGYLNEDSVRPDSVTETFFRVTTFLNHPHWYGVPVILEGGKGMPVDDKRIIVTFKHPDPCLCEGEHHATSRIEFRLGPNPGIAVQFYSRKPDTASELQERWMVFDYPAEESIRYLAEYSQLLTEAIAGNQFLFVSSREALASWRFIEPIMQHWRHQTTIPTYQLGTVPTMTPQSSVTILASKTIGMVGLGKMGMNLSLRLQDKGWQVVGYDPHPLAATDLTVTSSLRSLVDVLPEKKIIWIMVPNAAVDSVIFDEEGVASFLKRGDLIIDGGNSFYKDSIRRANKLAKRGIGFIDVGVSGGPGGARSGPALMVGGRREDVGPIESLFYDLALHNGYRYFPGQGAGHFVKMVHNGIEYGMMQSLAEGFAILAKSEFDINLETATEIYNNGSVIQSRLIEWLHNAFVIHGQELKDISSTVAHTGEGDWTVKTARELGINVPAIKNSLIFREMSSKQSSYIGKVLSALREQFGGHAALAEPTANTTPKHLPRKFTRKKT